MKEKELILGSGLFNTIYYIENYNDVKDNKLSPIDHYFQIGIKENRKPNKDFDPTWYSNYYEDVQKSGLYPLIHYIKYGKEQQRFINKTEYDSYIKSDKKDIQHIKRQALVDKSIPSNYAFLFPSYEEVFDKEYYLDIYPDVKNHGMNPFEHFCLFGWKEGRNPNKEFDTKFYLETYKDVQELKINPLVHYILFGKDEQRFTNLTQYTNQISNIVNKTNEPTQKEIHAFNRDAYHLMKNEKWNESLLLWEKTREKYPKDPSSYIQAGKALFSLERYDEAVKIWILHDNSICRNLVFDSLEKIKDQTLYNEAWNFLLEEMFSFKEPTVIVEKIHSLYITYKELFDKYISIIKKHSQNKIDYFTKIALGLVEKPDVSYVKGIFFTENINILKYITNSTLMNRDILTTVNKYQLYRELNNTILKRAYSNLFEEFHFEKKSPINKKLKIAVCVSGQLRGYKEAFKTWDKLNLSDHETDIFCCIWNNIGRKEISKSHIHRVFDKEFTKLFIKEVHDKSWLNLQSSYKNLFNAFKRTKFVDKKEIKDFYSAKKVKIVNECEYSNKSNMYKMHYMIQKCYEMIDNPNEYDLIIRIRPDKIIEEFNIGLNEILYNCDEQKIFSDYRPYIHHGVGLVIGDQVAIGRPKAMEVYSKTFEKIINSVGVFSSKDFRGFRPHMSLFLSLLENKIVTANFPEKVRFGLFAMTPPLTPKELTEIIEKDLKNDPEKKVLFLEAIQKDEENEKHNN